MTREDIIRMAREAGMETHERKQQVRIGSAAVVGGDSTDVVMRFAALIAEDCAKRCEKISVDSVSYGLTDKSWGADSCVAAIREAYKP